MENGNAGGCKRDTILEIRVTEAERDFIYEKMRKINTNNLTAYGRKMPIDCYAINTGYSHLKAVAAEIQKASVNFNQINRSIQKKMHYSMQSKKITAS